MRPSAEHLLEHLRDACQRLYGDALVSVVVFGSWARGTATPASDLDVLIVADSLPAGRLARARMFEPVELALEPQCREVWGAGEWPLRLSPIFKTPAEVEQGSPLFLDMTEHARLLFDRSGFFAAFLERLRARMAELGTRRVSTRAGAYWIYKPGAKPGEVIRL